MPYINSTRRPYALYHLHSLERPYRTTQSSPRASKSSANRPDSHVDLHIHCPIIRLAICPIFEVCRRDSSGRGPESICQTMPFAEALAERGGTEPPTTARTSVRNRAVLTRHEVQQMLRDSGGDVE